MTTLRGFPLPSSLPDERRHGRERFYVVRLTEYERQLLRPETSGVVGRFSLMSLSDGTFELVRYADG